LREQFHFVRAGDEFYCGVFFFDFLKIFRDEQGLAALRLGIEHGDADDLRREWPQAHEFCDLFALGLLSDGVGDFFNLAEKLFLLRLVKVLQRQRGSLNVKNERGHEKLNLLDKN
jgi:hypothetical protein